MWCLTCTLHCACLKHELQCVKQECTGISRQIFNTSSILSPVTRLCLLSAGEVALFARCFLQFGDQQGSGGVSKVNPRLRCGLQEILVGLGSRFAFGLDLPEVK